MRSAVVAALVLSLVPMSGKCTGTKARPQAGKAAKSGQAKQPASIVPVPFVSIARPADNPQVRLFYLPEQVFSRETAVFFSGTEGGEERGWAEGVALAIFSEHEDVHSVTEVERCIKVHLIPGKQWSLIKEQAVLGVILTATSKRGADFPGEGPVAKR